MESIVRNVRDIAASERQAIERVLGEKLQENQQIIIQVVNLANEAGEKPDLQDGAASSSLPDWCDVYAGLDERQIAEVEEIVLQRADLSRCAE